MSRFSSLFLASGLAILPIGAFAQQAATPGVAPMAQPAPSTSQMSKSDVKTSTAPDVKTTGVKTTGVKTADAKTSEVKTPEAKTTASTKDAKSMHAKTGTKTVPATAKPAEPGKS